MPAGRDDRPGQAIDVDQYKWGFSTEIEMDKAPKGLNEDIVRLISAKKNEPNGCSNGGRMPIRRWLTMREPTWARVEYPEIDFQDLHYYARTQGADRPKSLDEVDPELLRTYEKLGIPLREQEILAGVEPQNRVAVDAVFDSISSLPPSRRS